MKVQVLSRKLVTPSSPTPPHLQNFKLSSIEQLGPLNYAPIIFYYVAKEEDHGESHIQERSAELQKSLAEVLTLFYPLGGRYNNDNLSLDCNDKGAEYLEAQVSGCTLGQLLERGEIDTELLDHLVAHPSQPDDNPFVMVQFNVFECGGVVISASINHKITDAFTDCTFLRTWATACRIGIEKLDYFPTFPLASFCPPKDELAGTSGFHRLIVDNTVVNKRFVFNGATLSKLKALANTSGTSINAGLLKHQHTRVEVVTALVWRILVRISQASHGLLRPAFLSHAINMRGKTGMPIPENSCGCFLSPAVIQFIPEDHESKMEFHDFVNLVRDGIRTTTTDLAKVSNGDDIFFQVSREQRKHIEAFTKSEADSYLFSSWCGFPFYEADFGWGKPTWVSSMFIPKGAVLLVDTKDGDGIEIVVGLDGRNMLLFQQNLDSLGIFSGEDNRITSKL